MVYEKTVLHGNAVASQTVTMTKAMLRGEYQTKHGHTEAEENSDPFNQEFIGFWGNADSPRETKTPRECLDENS